MKSFFSIALLASLACNALGASLPARSVLKEDDEFAGTGAYFVEARDEHLIARDNAKCIRFQSSITWYYTFAGAPWGTKSGKGPSAAGNLCVPTNNTAGGAMYIGPNPNPGPGSTKFECKFPTSGTAFCDISLVDGYSLSMTCKANQLTNPLGGGVNLYRTGTCPHQKGVNCINDHGYDASQSTVDAFFQAGVKNGNNYCIWKNCNIPSFPVSQPLSCTVSGGK